MVDRACNYDLSNTFTPVRYWELEKLLNLTKYDKDKTEFLVNGFKKGFDLGYRGNRKMKIKAPNLKLTVGSKVELWNKVMKEVRARRYAGPYKRIPFEFYIQSPIGLVPKDINKTRLIFHLSYPKGGTTSINFNTPDELSSVNYPDFDEAIRLCLQAEKWGVCYLGKSDMTSAFRHLCIRPCDWCLLVMKAQDPETGVWYYFVDKCLPFGSSVSCSHFQAFSDSIAHIIFVRTGFLNINYLDDFLFVAYTQVLCNGQIQEFLDVCSLIKFPVAFEKTVWACQMLSFLGLLINTKSRTIGIPISKLCTALELINKVINAKNGKTTQREVQKLCGFLNFLCKSIVPGRVFLRRAYALAGTVRKPHHHINVTREVKLDMQAWQTFLRGNIIFERKFFEFSKIITSTEVDWYTDASRLHGLGGVCNGNWFIGEWDHSFIFEEKVSINYLELFALTVSILCWAGDFKNQNITIFCDNMSVVQMVNSTTSSCRNCMVLLRLIVLQGLIHNTRIIVKHVPGVLNEFSDLLSRHKYKQFWQLARRRNKNFSKNPVTIPEEIWPISKIWLY